jgi:aarF domain-containing kinase
MVDSTSRLGALLPPPLSNLELKLTISFSRQAIGANAAVLPKSFQQKFASLFDDAPQLPYSIIHKVFLNELGAPPDGPNGIFEIFEKEAVASASIAQVHKAKLWGKDEWVAVKVQKPDVGIQIAWDLNIYRVVMWMFERAFELPVYFVVGEYAESFLKLVALMRSVQRLRVGSSQARARF